MINLIPEDTYKATVKQEPEQGESSVKGTPYVRIAFTITEGPHAGRVVTESFWLSDKTWERTMDVLAVLGFQGDDITRTDLCVGGVCKIKVTHELETDRDGSPRLSRDGEPLKRTRVAWVNALPKEMEAGKKATFVEQMRDRLRQRGAVAAPPRATPERAPAAEPARGTDEDGDQIPF